MINNSLLLVFFIATVCSGRYVKNDGTNGYPAKLFDYYDVAKGNIPTYLTEVDKPLETFQEDSEPVKLDGMVDNNIEQMMRQEHAIEVQPAENRPENLENYDEYAEESVKKPLETPDVIDGDTLEEKSSNTTIPIIPPRSPSSTNETEPISNVEDVMILRTVKPLCSIGSSSEDPCE